jgi:hypothetical protein
MMQTLKFRRNHPSADLQSALRTRVFLQASRRLRAVMLVQHGREVRKTSISTEFFSSTHPDGHHWFRSEKYLKILYDSKDRAPLHQAAKMTKLRQTR